MLVSPGPAASLGSRSLSTIGVRSRVCHAPIPAFGHRWCGVGYVVSCIRHISRPRQNVSNRDFILFWEQLKENVVHRDKKKSRQKDHESCFFSLLGMAVRVRVRDLGTL